MVDEPFELTYAELCDLDVVEADITMTCVSNQVGGNLVGNARWLGVRTRDLLDRAGPQRRADQLVGRSTDGYTCGFPIEAAYDRPSLIAVGMNGEPLPLRHGFPARLVTPGIYGYVGSTKWLTELEVTTFDTFDQYWVPRLRRAGADQDDGPHRHAPQLRGGGRGPRDGRRGGMGADARHQRRRGPHRRR